MRFAVLCTGDSMSRACADAVRALRVVAVNGAFHLAPWAEALVANDVAWWNANPATKKFAGRRFSASRVHGVELVQADGLLTSTCSGVLGLEVAKLLGATEIILLGADLRGSHFFGPYTGLLKNTTPERFKYHARQFAAWGHRNPTIRVTNATPGSALDCFPIDTLENLL